MKPPSGGDGLDPCWSVVFDPACSATQRQYAVPYGAGQGLREHGGHRIADQDALSSAIAYEHIVVWKGLQARRFSWGEAAIQEWMNGKGIVARNYGQGRHVPMQALVCAAEIYSPDTSWHLFGWREHPPFWYEPVASDDLVGMIQSNMVGYVIFTQLC
jgi:hypothetical protein